MIPKGLGDQVAALLVETRAESKEKLDSQIQTIIGSLDDIKKLDKVTFSTNPELNAKLWSGDYRF